MLSGVPGARDHVTQRADVRDRAPPPMTYNEPRGQYGDVTGQRGDFTGHYRYYAEATPRDAYRGPVTPRYSDSTQNAPPPGLNTPPWNKIPGQSSFSMQLSSFICFFQSFSSSLAIGKFWFRFVIVA